MSQTPETPSSAAAISGDAAGVLAFPASVAQQVFWYMELLQGEVTAFNVPLRFRLNGPLDVALLERTMNTIIDRHEALRTVFGEDHGELLQIVKPELKLSIPVIDISHLPSDTIAEEADRLGSIEARRPFSLAKGPLIRAELVRQSPEHHIFHVTVHHALFDGMSMTVLTQEIAAIYQAYFDGKECPLDPLPIQYGDFSVWQKEYLEGPEIAKQLAYWKDRLKGMVELDLPTDFPRPAVKTWKGEITSVLLSKELTERLQSLAAKHGATLFHIQLAAYNILLSRYCGTTDIAVGTPVTGRTREELEPLMGVFINSLILRSNLSGNPAFGSFLETIRDTSLEALENQDLPFEYLVRELKPDRDQSRNPLFQVNFNHHRSFAKAGSFGGVSLTPIPSRSPGTIFDLHFFMVERTEGWRASCDYSTELFTRASAERMLGHFKRLLEDIAEHPDRNIDELEILPAPEKQQLLHEWSGIPAVDSKATIGGLFIETAERFPTRIALRCGNRSLTYSQLHSEATRVATLLRESGLHTGDLVAVTANPSLEMISAFTGVLLAGGCCVPIDPAYPRERFQLLLTECGAKLALFTHGCEASYPADWHGKLLAIPGAGEALAPLALPDVALTSDHPAHLLFTSGSTGRPKGVLLPHRGVTRLVRNQNFLNITPDDVFLQAAPASFDASLLEIWGPLLNGGRLVLLPDGPGLAEITGAVREHGVTTLWLTSGLFQLIMDEEPESLKGLRHLLAGGDVLSPAHVRRALDVLPGTRLINGYGPTENTTFTTCHLITRADLEKPSIPIGKPVANTTVYLLDAALRPVPTGIPGELFTGGCGLALGYHGAADLTAEKFIEHPQFGRLYRTGDLCRWSSEGVIEFIGRRDHQVKVRGFRIELGEIESILTSHPLIRQAKAAVRGETAETKRILTWVITEPGSDLTPEDVAKFVAGGLPAFMRPDAIATVESFPLNANGKIQVSALQDPARREPLVQKPAAPPVGKTEERLAEIWSELLGISDINRDDDFFALGGHSLMALRMFARLNREFDRSLPLATLLGHPTIARLADILAPAEKTAMPGIVPGPGGIGNIVTLAKGGSQPGLFCIHGGDGGVLFYRSLASLMPAELPLHAIESLELGNSGPVAETSIEDTARAYIRNMRSIQPQGPWRLAGYSFGGVVAHEMACQLVAEGEEVEFLGLFDTYNPAAPTRKYSMSERLGVFWQQHSHLPISERVGLVRARFKEGVQTNRRIKAELKDARSSGPAEAYSDLRRIQVREENWRAMKAYKPGIFSGRITLFRTSAVSDKVERPSDYGWACHTTAGLDMISVDGEHLTLFAPENIASLAGALANSLQQGARSAR